MVQRFIPAPGSGDAYFQVFFDLVLPDKILQAARPQAGIQSRIFIP
jgi:hypothetical protein